MFRILFNENDPRYHAQNSQDIYVERLLCAKRNGYFVDIGAYDGIHLSNTYFFEKELGWDGLCVDANPITFTSLSANRQCTCIHTAIDVQPGKREIILDGDCSEIVTPNGIITNRPSKTTAERAIVNAMTINDLFSKYGVPDHFDYLSVDIDGMDIDVLETLDYDKWSFSILTFEHLAFRFRDPRFKEFIRKKQSLHQLLYEKGYLFVTDLKSDSLFMHKDFNIHE